MPLWRSPGQGWSRAMPNMEDRSYDLEVKRRVIEQLLTHLTSEETERLV